jgi:hypothetical protein
MRTSCLLLVLVLAACGSSSQDDGVASDVPGSQETGGSSQLDAAAGGSVRPDAGSGGKTGGGGNAATGGGGGAATGGTALTDSGTGGSPPKDSGIVTGGPGCGLASAAFCDTFDGPSAARGRAGELNPTWWSAGRLAPQGPTANGQVFGIGAATLRPTRDGAGQLPACRAGLPDQVFPDGDTLICDPSTDIKSNYLLTAVAAQNYGANSYRVRQPFDFAGRTGKIVLDAEVVAGGLLGWISLDVTEDPIAVPSFQTLLNLEGGVLPKNGFSIQWNEPCNGTAGTNVSMSELHVFDNYAETILKPTSPVCVTSAWGKLNHIEVTVSQQKIEVYVSPVSADGVTFAAAQLVYSASVSLPFSRGYVQLTTHNHATLKYSEASSGFRQGFTNLDAWIARWDNVGFDGPVVTGPREYEVPDSLVTYQTVMDTGWTIADESKGPNAVLHFKGVDLTAATSARVALTAWYCGGCGQPAASFLVKYRLNGKAWHDRPLTAAELADFTGGKCQGALGELLDAPVGELVAGDNTLELVASNIPQNYPPGVVNVDLVVSTQ